MKIDIKLFDCGARTTGLIQDNEAHIHDCYQLCLADDNTRANVSGQDIIIPSQRVLIINHLTEHRIEMGNWQILLIDHDSKLKEVLKNKLQDKPFHLAEFEDFKELFDDPSKFLNCQRKNLREEISNSLEILKTHKHNCTLEEIAKSVALSPDRFRHIFKEQMGITFKNYVLWQKIKRAFTLKVQNPLSPLSQIAIESGFSDQAHFSKTLKKTFGYSAKVLKKSL